MKRITILALLVALFTMGIQARGKQPIAFKNLPKEVKKEVEKNFTEDQFFLLLILAPFGIGLPKLLF